MFIQYGESSSALQCSPKHENQLYILSSSQKNLMWGWVLLQVIYKARGHSWVEGRTIEEFIEKSEWSIWRMQWGFGKDSQLEELFGDSSINKCSDVPNQVSPSFQKCQRRRWTQV